jgi:2-polyprenyl-3-methyl-5-hydroxy-6-metoxy-1,4-benzoquinol methylase
MTEFENTACLVCNSDDYFPYSSTGQFGLPTHVVICKVCGFSYLNPRWTKKRYDHFYSKEYDSYYRPQVINKNYNYDPARSIKDIVARAEGIVDFTNPGLNVLDVGTGMGDSLIYLKQSVNTKANYYAIESSEVCLANLREHNINVLTSDVDSQWHLEHQNKFDVIIMRHVLEHFLDPRSVLQKVRHVLRPGGVLYIAVPDAKNAARPLLRRYFRVVHVSYFSRISLTNLLTQVGLKAIRMVEGDERERKEIFTFCEVSEPGAIKTDPEEWLRQKKVYDFYKKYEYLFRLRYWIAEKIILPLR